MSDDRRRPPDVTASRPGAGRGGGSENRRDERSSRAVGELSAFDIVEVVNDSLLLSFPAAIYQ